MQRLGVFTAHSITFILEPRTTFLGEPSLRPRRIHASASKVSANSAKKTPVLKESSAPVVGQLALPRLEFAASVTASNGLI